MCTVTFIPHGAKIFITSNRDESPGRRSQGLTSRHQGDHLPIHFPMDNESQGSWIALADSGRAVCLLNGGFIPFTPEPAYRQSRGLVVIDAAEANDIDSFVHDYELEGIAPFTLLLYEHGKFVELVWDGFKRHIRDLDTATPQLWSSVTLYPPEVREWRRTIFTEWIQDHAHYDRESIMAFHCLRKGDEINDFVMNRNDMVKTLSVTSIRLEATRGSILHLDLERNSREEVLIQYDR